MGECLDQDKGAEERSWYEMEKHDLEWKRKVRKQVHFVNSRIEQSSPLDPTSSTFLYNWLAIELENHDFTIYCHDYMQILSISYS